MQTKGWFGPKTIGYGVGPTSWQGWLVCLAMLALALGNRFLPYARWGLPPWAHPATGIGAVFALLIIAWLTYSAE